MNPERSKRKQTKNTKYGRVKQNKRREEAELKFSLQTE